MSVCLGDTRLPLEMTSVTTTSKHSSVKQLYSNKNFFKKEFQWSYKKGKEARSWGHHLPCPFVSQVNRKEQSFPKLHQETDGLTCRHVLSITLMWTAGLLKHGALWQGCTWQDAINASCTQQYQNCCLRQTLLNMWMLWLGVSMQGSCQATFPSTQQKEF